MPEAEYAAAQTLTSVFPIIHPQRRNLLPFRTHEAVCRFFHWTGGMKFSKGACRMSNVPEGAQLSDDGYWWWDGSAWQAVEDAWHTVQETAAEAWDRATGDSQPEGGTSGGGGASASYDYEYGDGGLPPGGVPEQHVCDLGPCPSCWENDQMSAPCVYGQGHGAEHQCAHGDLWEQADASTEPLPLAVGTPVATAKLSYDSGSNLIGAGGNTTGWPRGRIYVVGEVYCDGTVVKRLERAPCESSTSCALPDWSTTPDPGTHWEIEVTGEGPRYSPVTDTATVDVP
jgi:hypothetical protein